MKHRNYKYDCITNTLILSKNFLHRAAEYGSDEYVLLQTMKEEVPGLRISYQTSKHQKRCKDSQLTIKAMKRYLSCLRDSSTHLRELDRAVIASATQEHPLKAIREWFKENYPNYNSIPRFDDEGYLIACPINPGTNS